VKHVSESYWRLLRAGFVYSADVPANAAPIFLVEDDPDTAAIVVRWLSVAGYVVEHLADAEECLAALSRYVPSLICLDVDLPGMSGMDALEQIHARHPRLPILMLTADRDVETVVRAMQIGAYDYLAKPIDRQRLVTSVANALERSRMGQRLRELERCSNSTDEYEGMVGKSPMMQQLFSELDHVSQSDVTVLVHGESGTGKELVARAIHARSGRSRGPFVALNCAAVPESLIETEFFGHEKGAFTGASTRRMGRFEQSQGGTLFLDEIAELAPTLQAKLLRALQERKVVRVGGNDEVPVDFRLVAATHRDLLKEVATGRFREDLFYRIAVFELELPPLRERVGDIPLLCEKILSRIDPNRSLTLSTEANAALSGHDFPGNIRELENALQRAAVLCRDGVIALEHLPRRLVAGGPALSVSTTPELVSGKQERSMEEIEKEALRTSLERASGNVAQVVRELGIGRTTVYRKLREFGLR
jgi:two-component system, NtrC family, response regulator HydG